MEFHLTYEGLLSTKMKAPEKHAIRRALHPQLRELWRRMPVLNGISSGPDPIVGRSRDDGSPHTIRGLSDRFSEFGFRWVPLATERMSLLCEVDILFFRQGRPGTLIVGGDIDGRLKAVFDALQKPRQLSELGGATPEADEDPFFCLVENDKLISRVAATTTPLLEPERDPNFVRLIMKVTVCPYEVHLDNLHFG